MTLSLATGSMTTEPAPASAFHFSRVGAERLTEEIRRNLHGAIAGLIRAREGRAWAALGYASWHEYCEGEFGDLRDLALPASERRHLVASYKEARIPNRPIAERLGISPGTVAGDVAQLRRDGWQGEPSTVLAADGSERPARIRAVADRIEPDYRGLSRVSEAAARVAAQEDRGLTSIELDAETGWPMGTASANLSKLERRGWIVRLDHGFRRDRAPYVITGMGRAELAARLVPLADAEVIR